jgi:hypothetical protein
MRSNILTLVLITVDQIMVVAFDHERICICPWHSLCLSSLCFTVAPDLSLHWCELHINLKSSSSFTSQPLATEPKIPRIWNHSSMSSLAMYSWCPFIPLKHLDKVILLIELLGMEDIFVSWHISRDAG